MKIRIKLWILWIVSSCCRRTGLDDLVRFIRGPSMSILTLHRIGEQWDPLLLTVSKEYVDDLIAAIQKEYAIVSLTQGLGGLKSKKNNHVYVLSFDDGYADNFFLKEYALRGIPAIIYIATGFIGKKTLWVMRLMSCIHSCQREVLDLRVYGGEVFFIRSLQEKENALIKINYWLKTFPHQELLVLVDKICSLCKEDKEVFQERMLSWQEIALLEEAGVEIGGHTVNHAILTSIPAKWAQDEIQACADKLRLKLKNNEGCHFSYPNGTKADFNKSITGYVKRSGFSSAVTTVFGVNTKSTDRYELKRIPVTEQSFRDPFGRFSVTRFLSETSGTVALIKEVLISCKEKYFPKN